MSATAPARVWTIRDLLSWSRDYFEKHEVDSPRLTAELLLSHVLEVQRIRLYTDLDRPLEQPELARYRELVLRRVRGEPAQYLLGSQDFYGRRFRTDRRALIPRPETELVVERVLRHLPKDESRRVVDVGCGTGAIGLTIAAERPQTDVVLVDISPDALELARENAELLGLSERVEFREGHLLEPLGDERFDVVVANLPYVPDGQRDSLAVHIREHEPALALFAGVDGLDLIRQLTATAAAHVTPGGLLVLEHAENHGAAIVRLLDSPEWTPAVVEKDLAGLERFTWSERAN